MAVIELSEQEYNKIKADLNEGLSINEMAKKYNCGNRRVSLVSKSKSYKSYISLRAAQRRKRLENTPAKAPTGGSELTNTDIPLEEKGKQIDEPEAPENDMYKAEGTSIFDEDIEALELAAKSKEILQADNAALWTGLAVVVGSVVVIVALIWAAVYVITN